MTLPQKLIAPLTALAALRAHAVAWADAARVLGVSEEVCREWPRLYHDAYLALYHEAAKHARMDGFWEGIAVYRELGRHQQADRAIRRRFG